MQFSSMTGFGKAQANYEGKIIHVEIKSLNSKQADIFTKIPIYYKEKEIELRNYISKSLNRGKIDFIITVETPPNDKSSRINEDLFKTYFWQIEALNKKLNKSVSNDSIFQAIMRMPDIFTQESEVIHQLEWDALFSATEQAVESLLIFRKQEGAALSEDIFRRIKKIEALNLKVEDYEKDRLESIKARISKNLNEFFDTDKLDKNRFEQELVYYIEKLDVTEEKIRLANHCKYFIEEATTEEAIGKKLIFLVQEMGREINTLGSKANHSEMQKIVVEMKDELEKIKEQMMNVL